MNALKGDSCSNAFYRAGKKCIVLASTPPWQATRMPSQLWACCLGSHSSGCQGRAKPLLTVFPLYCAPIKAALSEVFRVAASFGSSDQCHSSGKWGGLLLWVNCLPLQLMNLCGHSFVCFPGVRINECSYASTAKEEGKKCKDGEA